MVNTESRPKLKALTSYTLKPFKGADRASLAHAPRGSAGFTVTRLPYILLPLPSTVLPSHPNLKHAASLSASPQINSTPRNRSGVWRALSLPFLLVLLLEGPYPSTATLPPPLGCPHSILDQQGHAGALLLPCLLCYKDLLVGFKATIHLSWFGPPEDSLADITLPSTLSAESFTLPCFFLPFLPG